MFLLYLRLLVRRGSPWRLGYERVYNLFLLVTEPLRFISLLWFGHFHPWADLGVIYALYLLLEILPFLAVERKIDTGRKYVVLLLYPLYSLANAALRALALPVWLYKRFITREMRRKTESWRGWRKLAQAGGPDLA